MENSFRFFQNTSCRYFPCHKGVEDFNCLFCYCPLYGQKDCPGTPKWFTAKDGSVIRDCSDCVYPHKAGNYPAIMQQLAASVHTGKKKPAADAAGNGVQKSVRTDKKILTAEEEDVRQRIQKRWDSIAKPIDSLGRLEKILTQIGVIQKTDQIRLEKRTLLIFAGDHGVVAEGVTQTDSSVTRIVTENFAKGGALTSILARKAGTDLYIIDAGMDTDRYPEKNLVTGAVIDRKIRRGTGDIAVENAMTRKECLKALQTGSELVRELQEKGCDIVAAGEMGIGNTTPTAALIGHFLHQPAEKVTGRGAGLSDEGLQKKIRAVDMAMRRAADLTDPVDVMAAIGGLEIAMMSGVFLGGARYRMPVMVDGVIAQAAALAAAEINPDVRKILIPSHQSGEEYGSLCLQALDLHPILHADMTQGEGSGCMMLLPLLDMALAVYRQMSSFDECNITPYERMQES